MAWNTSARPLRLLTVDAACDRLGGICHSTFYNLANSGQIPLVKLGRLTRVREADLDAFVAAMPEGRSPGPKRRSGAP